MPSDLKTTRVPHLERRLQRQIGDNMAVSASYLGNYMTNVWGVVTGNPGTIPAGASPTGPCTLQHADRRHADVPNCSTAPLDLRRELTQLNPAVGQYIGYLDYFTDHGWQNYNGLLLSVQRRRPTGSAPAPTTRCRRARA